MILGVFMHVSRKHINKYINTFCFRMNNRHDNTFERFNNAMQLAFGKKMMYADLVQEF